MDPETIAAFASLAKLIEDTGSQTRSELRADMRADMRASYASLVTLVEDTSQSLRAEMAEMRSDLAETRADMDRGFERIEAATRRNTTSIAGGGAVIVALHRWAQQRDRVDTKRDRDLRDLRARLLKVERALKRRTG